MAINALLELMEQLRDPATGCPWDKKQNYQSLVPYTVEEVYELIEAIEAKEVDAIKLELGDLLFQIVFYCQLAKEERLFDFDDVVSAIVEKMRRRHPHVFTGAQLEDDEALSRNWETIKASEKPPGTSLSSVCQTLPALKYAQKMQKKASQKGFDWKEVAPVYAKIEEEIAEVKEAVITERQMDIEDEVGDVLFAVVNLARHLKVDAETALRRSSNKFKRRFDSLERSLVSEEASLQSKSEAELLDLWDKAKQATD